MNSYEMVKQFHETFGHPAYEVPNPIALKDPKLRKLRVLLIAHELAELCQGLAVDLCLNYDHEVMGHMTGKELEKFIAAHAVQLSSDIAPPDMVKVADALGDLDVVVNGGHLVFGLPGPAIIEEIHRSNMSKLGADGLPIYNNDGKIQKGPNYVEANIAAVLERTTYLWHTGGVDESLLAAQKSIAADAGGYRAPEPGEPYEGGEPTAATL